MVIALRNGHLDDVDAVLALWRRAEAEPTHTDDPESLALLIGHDPDALIVAEEEGELVATVVAGWDGWRGSIYRLVVAPSHRRQGLAARLVDRAEERLRIAGASRLQAIVVANASDAVNFWASTRWERQAPRLRFVRG